MYTHGTKTASHSFSRAKGHTHMADMTWRVRSARRPAVKKDSNKDCQSHDPPSNVSSHLPTYLPTTRRREKGIGGRGLTQRTDPNALHILQ